MLAISATPAIYHDIPRLDVQIYLARYLQNRWYLGLMDRPQRFFNPLTENSFLFIVDGRVPFHPRGVPVKKVRHENLV